MDTLETPSEPVAETAMEAAFMEAASKVEKGEQVESLIQEETPQVVETEENVPTAEELADPANADRARDPVSGKFIKKADAAPAPAPVDAPETAPDAQSVSEFEQKKRDRAAKEEERKNRSWENLNREKEELAARREEVRRYEESLRNPQQRQRRPEPREFSSQQLLDAHEDFKATAKAAFKRYQDTGDEAALDEFNRNDQLAEQAFANASEFYGVEQQEAQQAAMEHRNRTWVANMEAEIKAMPDLAKPDSPIAKEMLGLLKTHGAVFQMLPDGFKQAKEIAQLRLDAKDAPTLREQLKAEKAEVARLTALTQPSSGGLTSAPSKKSFDSMTLAEQEKYLERATAHADATQ